MARWYVNTLTKHTCLRWKGMETRICYSNRAPGWQLLAWLPATSAAQLPHLRMSAWKTWHVFPATLGGMAGQASNGVKVLAKIQGKFHVLFFRSNAARLCIGDDLVVSHIHHSLIRGLRPREPAWLMTCGCRQCASSKFCYISLPMCRLGTSECKELQQKQYAQLLAIAWSSGRSNAVGRTALRPH